MIAPRQDAMKPLPHNDEAWDAYWAHSSREVFLFLPRRLASGRWAWLQTVTRCKPWFAAWFEPAIYYKR